VGLAAFALWPALDPRPDLVWSQFVVGENAGKLRFSSFASSFLTGESAIWQTWLGPLMNAGLYLPLVAALLADLWRRRREVGADEAELWLYVLAFLVVYSFPTQRQPNYVLPTSAALAVLLALRWDALPRLPFQVTLGLLAVAALGVPVFAWLVERRLGTPTIGAAPFLLPAALGLLAAAGLRRPSFGREALPALALLALVVGSAVVAPFGRPFPEPALAEVRGRPVLAPDRFYQSQERYRFLLSGADLRGYTCPSGPVPCPPPDPAAGVHAALLLDVGDPIPPGWEAVAERPHFKRRHSTAQILEILGGRTELLVERLVLARPAPAPR